MGFPDVSFHGVTPWRKDGFGGDEHYVGVMFAGYERDKGAEVVYVASNAYWGELDVTLPELPLSMHWELVCSTWQAEQKAQHFESRSFRIGPRSVMVFLGR